MSHTLLDMMLRCLQLKNEKIQSLRDLVSSCDYVATNFNDAIGTKPAFHKKWKNNDEVNKNLQRNVVGYKCLWHITTQTRKVENFFGTQLCFLEFYCFILIITPSEAKATQKLPRLLK